ncbi:tryptophan 7-halogenase [Novosphingobium sp.]|uniref:tryptophan 7-halogenase n=1 Tax=Novosphingobium sp. TaxID=1874826 RepID=UPI0025F18631|nr:tryptophan 7-halogenase [Novosphingobium sp.]
MAAAGPLRRIVVAGDGPVGLLAAAALKRSLPPCDVVVISAPTGAAAFADRSATALPFTCRLHERLGIADTALLRRAAASHRLITRYFGWGGSDSHGVAAYGAELDPAMAGAFARSWGGGQRNVSADTAPGSIAEVLADAGRYAFPLADDGGAAGAVDHAMRWNTGAYRQILSEAAAQLGIAGLAGPVVGCKLDGQGGLRSVATAADGDITADLFVDCTGPDAKLLAALREHAVIDWADRLPVRTVYLAEPGPPVLALEDRMTLLPQGWLSELAGRDGLQTTLAASRSLDPQEVRDALGAPAAEAIPIGPARAKASWLGNVVALGDAAARFEPIGGYPLDLAHRQLALLLELLPSLAFAPAERAEYNRRAALMADAVRDTIAVHYAAPAAMAVFGSQGRSAQLDRTIDQYTRRGRMPFREEAPLAGQEFCALLVALGFAPGTTTLAAARPADEAAVAAAFAVKARSVLVRTPPYAEWLAGQLSA